MSFVLRKNVLHDYVELLRGKTWNETGGALYNVIRTMQMARHDRICGEDLTELDFGNIRLDGISFSEDGESPSAFRSSTMNAFNFRSGHFDWVVFVRFSPDLRRVITGSNDGTVIIWDAGSGLIISRLERQFETMISGAILSDGVHAVTVSRHELSGEKRLLIWNVSDGTLVSQNKLRSASLAPKDLSFDWVSPALLEEINACIKSVPNAFIRLKNTPEVLISSSIPLFTMCEGKKIINADAVIMAGLEKRIWTAWGAWDPALWDADTMERVRVFSGHQAPVLDMDCTPDESLFVSCSQDHSAIIWDIQEGKQVRTLPGNLQKVSALALSPDGEYYITGSYGTVLNLMHSKSGRLSARFICMKSGASFAVFTPDGRSAIVGSWDHNVYVIDMDTHEVTSCPHSSAVVSVAANDRYIVSCEDNGCVHLWDRVSLKPLRSVWIKAHPKMGAATITACALSGKGHYLAVGIAYADAPEKIVCVLRTDSLKKVSQRQYESSVCSLSFSPDEKSYVVGLENAMTYVFHTKTSKRVSFPSANTPIVKVRYLSQNTVALISSSVAVINHLDTGTYDYFGFGDKCEITAADISEDGKRIVVSYNDRVMTIDHWKQIVARGIQVDLRILNCDCKDVKTDHDTLRLLRQYGALL